ncbi:unnamed protein product, partial [marine sediment metagenome]
GGQLTAGTGAVDLDAGGTLDLNNAIISAGTVQIDSTGLTTIDALGDIAADDAVTFGAAKAGLVSTGGDITTSDDTITFNQAVTLIGDVALSTGGGAGDIITVAAVDGDGVVDRALQLTAGTGNVDLQAAVGGGQALGSLTVTSAATVDTLAVKVVDDISITADEINFGGGGDSVESTGSGTVTLRPTANDVDIEVAAAGEGAGELDLLVSDIAALKDGFGGIVIGVAGTGEHAITINAVTFNDPVTIQARANSGL